MIDNFTDASWLLATWQLQAALGSGYTAYMIAYTGIRSHHAAIDTTFRTIAFGLVATGVLLGMPATAKPLTIFAAFIATVSVGIAWRVVGMTIWTDALRWLDISWADDTPSAWAKISGEQAHLITQVSVLLNDGTRLRCNDASECGNLPLGPCVLGTNGDLLLYVTHQKRPGEIEQEAAGWNDPDHGARLTYLPTSSIKRLDVRRKPRERRKLFKVWRHWINRYRKGA